MLQGIINLAFLIGTALCVWLVAYGSYQVVNFLFRREGLRRVIARLPLNDSMPLTEHAE